MVEEEVTLFEDNNPLFEDWIFTILEIEFGDKLVFVSRIDKGVDHFQGKFHVGIKVDAKFMLSLWDYVGIAQRIRGVLLGYTRLVKWFGTDTTGIARFDLKLTRNVTHEWERKLDHD